MTSRPAESLVQMIRRVLADADAVGETITPERLAFAINSAGWTRGRLRSSAAPPGMPSAALIRLVRDFTHGDPRRHSDGLAERIADAGYRHIRNPVFPTRQDA